MTRHDEKREDPPAEGVQQRAIRMVGSTLGKTIDLLEARLKGRTGRRGRPLEAIPFATLNIPDTGLAAMVEMLDTDPTCDIETLSRKFLYPASLIERELPLYRARYQRWIDSESERAG